MLHFLQIMGPMSIPLTFIALANLVLLIWRGSQVFAADARQDPAVGAGINAILFWGVIAVVLGYLGMYTGAYRSLSAIAADPSFEVSPRLLYAAGKELATAPIAGLTLCLLSAIGWFALRSRYRRLPAAS